MLDGHIGKSSLQLFRTPVQSGLNSTALIACFSLESAGTGTLRFELGGTREAYRLHVKWWRHRAREWELWIGREPQPIPTGRRKGQTDRWEKWITCKATDCKVPGEGNLDMDFVDLSDQTTKPLSLERFQIRLFGADNIYKGIAIDEVQLLGLAVVGSTAAAYENTFPVKLDWKVTCVLGLPL